MLIAIAGILATWIGIIMIQEGLLTEGIPCVILGVIAFITSFVPYFIKA
jgi:hypothetical protein